jgi:ribosomal protein S18 acetylase RimI-like enzyme
MAKLYTELIKKAKQANTVLHKLSRQNTILIDEIIYLLTTTYDPKISDYFIYHDIGYRNYFEYLLKNKEHAIFACCAKETGNMVGFAHFNKISDNIFLKNIIVTDQYQDQGIGNYLLLHSLKKISNTRNFVFRTFQLDVFESNNRALNWYLKLGMEIEEYFNWYDISYYCKNGFGYESMLEKASRIKLEIKKDRFGFDQLILNDHRIGTVINKTRLIIRVDADYLLLERLYLFLKDSEIESVCLVTKKDFNFLLLDKSFQLSILLKDIKIK